MDIFRMNMSVYKSRVLRGVICFFMLVALAMALINSAMILLPAVIMAVISSVFRVYGYKTGYAAIARAVCRNE